MARTGKKSRWWYVAKLIHAVETGHPKRLKARDCPKCQRIMDVMEKADGPMENADVAA